MARWRPLYASLAGPRYPHLLAYAQLLTGDRNTADALVAWSLRRTFSRPRRLGTKPQVEAEVRQAIVARFLATAPTEGSVRPDSAAPEAVADAPVAARPRSEAPPVDPSLYAPPSRSQSPAADSTNPPPRTVLHMDSAEVPESGASQTELSDADERDPATPCAERSGGSTSESHQVHAALATLTPRARAVTVLRHYDGMAPGLIGAQLGLDVDVVVRDLRASHAALRAQLHISIPNEPDPTLNPGHASDQILVTPHGSGR